MVDNFHSLKDNRRRIKTERCCQRQNHENYSWFFGLFYQIADTSYPYYETRFHLPSWLFSHNSFQYRVCQHILISLLPSLHFGSYSLSLFLPQNCEFDATFLTGTEMNVKATKLFKAFRISGLNLTVNSVNYNDLMKNSSWTIPLTLGALINLCKV